MFFLPIPVPVTLIPGTGLLHAAAIAAAFSLSLSLSRPEKFSGVLDPLLEGVSVYSVPSNDDTSESAPVRPPSYNAKSALSTPVVAPSAGRALAPPVEAPAPEFSTSTPVSASGTWVSSSGRAERDVKALAFRILEKAPLHECA